MNIPEYRSSPQIRPARYTPEDHGKPARVLGGIAQGLNAASNLIGQTSSIMGQVARVRQGYTALALEGKSAEYQKRYADFMAERSRLQGYSTANHMGPQEFEKWHAKQLDDLGKDLDYGQRKALKQALSAHEVTGYKDMVTMREKSIKTNLTAQFKKKYDEATKNGDLQGAVRAVEHYAPLIGLDAEATMKLKQGGMKQAETVNILELIKDQSKRVDQARRLRNDRKFMARLEKEHPNIYKYVSKNMTGDDVAMDYFRMLREGDIDMSGEKEYIPDPDQRGLNKHQRTELQREVQQLVQTKLEAGKDINTAFREASAELTAKWKQNSGDWTQEKNMMMITVSEWVDRGALPPPEQAVPVIQRVQQAVSERIMDNPEGLQADKIIAEEIQKAARSFEGLNQKTLKQLTEISQMAVAQGMAEARAIGQPFQGLSVDANQAYINAAFEYAAAYGKQKPKKLIKNPNYNPNDSFTGFKTNYKFSPEEFDEMEKDYFSNKQADRVNRKKMIAQIDEELGLTWQKKVVAGELTKREVLQSRASEQKKWQYLRMLKAQDKAAMAGPGGGGQAGQNAESVIYDMITARRPAEEILTRIYQFRGNNQIEAKTAEMLSRRVGSALKDDFFFSRMDDLKKKNPKWREEDFAYVSKIYLEIYGRRSAAEEGRPLNAKEREEIFKIAVEETNSNRIQDGFGMNRARDKGYKEDPLRLAEDIEKGKASAHIRPQAAAMMRLKMQDEVIKSIGNDNITLSNKGTNSKGLPLYEIDGLKGHTLFYRGRELWIQTSTGEKYRFNEWAQHGGAARLMALMAVPRRTK